MVIKNLVLSGGSFRGYCYLGVLKYLNETQPDFYKNLENIVGVSIGAIFGSLVCLGYKGEDLIKIFCEIDEEKFRNITSESILNFFETFGLDDGEKLMKLIGILFKGKGFETNITFKELHEKTNVALTIVGCCLNKTKEVHFSHITHPEMEVLKAIRISTSIPFFYNPVKFENDLYVDGGIVNNFPIEIFEENLDETLAILLIGTDYDHQEINDIQGYFNSLVRNSVFKHVKKKIEKYKKHIVKIECNQCPYDLTICKDNKLSLINIGYDIISEHYLQG